MVGACPQTPQEKCKACRNGYPCHVHDPKDIDFEELAKKKRRKFSGKKKGKKRQTKASIKRKEKKE